MGIEMLNELTLHSQNDKMITCKITFYDVIYQRQNVKMLPKSQYTAKLTFYDVIFYRQNVNVLP